MAKAQAGGNSSESKSNTSILTAIEEDCTPRFPQSKWEATELLDRQNVPEWFLVE
jgi:hypothetical protein